MIKQNCLLSMICTKPQAEMLAFSFEAQTQRVKDMCLHIILSSFFLSPFFPICSVHIFLERSLLPKYSFIILLEFINPLVCQWMLCHLLNYLIWHCRNISPSQCTVCYMDWVTDTCSDNFCLNAIIIKNSCNPFQSNQRQL